MAEFGCVDNGRRGGGPPWPAVGRTCEARLDTTHQRKHSTARLRAAAPTEQGPTCGGLCPTHGTFWSWG